MIISQDQLNSLFEYREGQIFWKVRTAHRIQIGDRAGCLSNTDGHRYVRIIDGLHAEHRIIWMMHNGIIDSSVFIDHKDQNPLNNDLSNLRIATHSQNLCNRGKQKNNTSGFKGVVFDKRDGKWAARIVVMGKGKSLGYHKTPKLAHEAYKKAAILYHGEFANY